jgi:hypothetical protein
MNLVKMKLSNLMLVGLGMCLPVAAQDPKSNEAVDPHITSEAHSSLFRSPNNSESVGARTEVLTAGFGEPGEGPVTRRNFIDDHIFGKMERDGVPHAPLSSDREFLRRARLDITGRPPAPEEIREFLADSSPDKREKLIDRLVGSPEFVDKWSYFLMDTLRVSSRAKGHQLFHYYLKQSLAADRPYDDFARSVISSSGKSNKVVAAVNPIVREHVEGKPGQVDSGDDLRKIHQLDSHDEINIQLGKVFLGINMSCISCHDGAGHLEKVNAYLTTKTRVDFYQQAAFYGNTRYIPHVERTESIMGHFIVDDLGEGYDTEGETMLRVPRLGGANTPKYLLTDEEPAAGKHTRTELARMMTSDPQFARATVNLFWSKMMEIGIVEPVDEFDPARLDPDNLPEGWTEAQPSHPELLEALAAYFRENDYSVHKLFKVIANSSAYQLSARFPEGEWNDTYTRYYARKYVRMLTAQEVHDAVTIATGVPGEVQDGRRGGKSVPMVMQASEANLSGDLKSFMQAFGHSNRNTAAARALLASPLQPIMMMQSSVVRDRLRAEDSRLQKLLTRYKDGAVVDEMFLSTLGREPSSSEKDVALTVMADDRVEGAQNLQWALLNLSEFLYNF